MRLILLVKWKYLGIIKFYEKANILNIKKSVV